MGVGGKENPWKQSIGDSPVSSLLHDYTMTDS